MITSIYQDFSSIHEKLPLESFFLIIGSHTIGTMKLQGYLTSVNEGVTGIGFLYEYFLFDVLIKSFHFLLKYTSLVFLLIFCSVLMSPWS